MAVASGRLKVELDSFADGCIRMAMLVAVGVVSDAGMPLVASKVYN